eukprot:8122-Heterococcus_DN1.PRE.1
MRHFQGRVNTWDVVNEAFCTDGSGSWTQSPILSLLGESYVSEAFAAARQADSSCKLLYNDCTVASAGYAKSDNMYKLVADAASEREWGHPAPTAVRTNIQRYAALGLTVNVSEMDVRTAKLKHASEEQRDVACAAVYTTVLNTCLQEPNFIGLTTWGVTDKHRQLRVCSAIHASYRTPASCSAPATSKSQTVLNACQEI